MLLNEVFSVSLRSALECETSHNAVIRDGDPFLGHGGGWGYSGHSVEAIRFMCDTDVLLGGFGLFGGRGGYMGRIKVRPCPLTEI